MLVERSEAAIDVCGFAVALEGPCSAGKTTLGRSLMTSFVDAGVEYVADYCDHVGGGRNLPPPFPRSYVEEEAALNKFLYIEWERYAAVRRASPHLVLVDRSVETLVAHCRGLTAVTGVDYRSLNRRVLARSKLPVWPKVVLYLDVPNDIVRSRGTSKFSPDSIFMNPEFNDGLRRYFVYRSRSVPVVFLDGTKSRSDLHTDALLRLTSLLPFAC